MVTLGLSCNAFVAAWRTQQQARQSCAYIGEDEDQVGWRRQPGPRERRSGCSRCRRPQLAAPPKRPEHEEQIRDSNPPVRIDVGGQARRCSHSSVIPQHEQKIRHGHNAVAIHVGTQTSTATLQDATTLCRPLCRPVLRLKLTPVDVLWRRVNHTQRRQQQQQRYKDEQRGHRWALHAADHAQLHGLAHASTPLVGSLVARRRALASMQKLCLRARAARRRRRPPRSCRGEPSRHTAVLAAGTYALLWHAQRRVLFLLPVEGEVLAQA